MAEAQTAPIGNPSWDRVQLARHPKRPHSIDYIQRLFTNFHEIHGDRAFSDDHAIIAGMGWFDDRPVMVIGQQKGRNTKQKVHHNFGMPHPEGYRKAMRVMELAAKFGRPVIAMLDTPGAYHGKDAEERGQGRAIAHNLREMSRLGVPVIRRRDRRRWERWRARARRRQPDLHAGERGLQRDIAGELCGDHLSRFRQGSAGGGRAEADRHRSSPIGFD
jgi:hypothetical protein